ncbi:MAG: VCBS repeat-containing protein [Planctomycetaceae bacterium]|nr:VCBS repeat-containing protein [Planctomycetaceae bacterium]
MLRLPIVMACVVVSGSLGNSVHAAEPGAFEKVVVSEKYYAEGAGIGDFNHDGVMDIVCGPFWYAGPDFASRHQFYPSASEGGEFPNDRGYSDNFFSYGYDFNGDGWTDVLRFGFPGTPAYWYENPQGKEGDWARHEALPNVDNESPTFVDVNGDGRPDIVCSAAGRLGYGTFEPANPTAAWTFHAISDAGPWQRFTHGLGVGDVNGDGRQDLLTSTGWFAQPESTDGDPLWEPHAYPFCPGGAQMFAYDVDGDGDNDVITSLQAHAYGLSWFENVPGNDGGIEFVPHEIMSPTAEPGELGISCSHLHAVDLHDMDGDGLLDIVTGKCYWAHNGHDPGARDPAVLYYFKLVRDNGQARFAPQMIDDNSGVGRQVSIGDLNDNGRPDIVVANKKGVFVFRQ